ncbi:radical SAM protein [Paenarthrobacter sp. OM7]|uniref:radical SAM protein n=1 Tax=Paenarthrobacter sp. OM7 TaxID=3041264 RepID=UPI002468A623|nr:radical SAM protein [Paenarthrobacter sp. OM7]WGM18771.1 radical SAM protein [Paenarthrobacter sp. OM7]
MIETAQSVRSANHANLLHLHSVVYPIDFCTSSCTYCGLSQLLAKEGAHGVRGGMPPETFNSLIGDLRNQGYRTHELVFGTVAEDQRKLADRIARWVERTRLVDEDCYIIVNCDTLQPGGYEVLRSAGANAIWTFMEAMDPVLYASKHKGGIKADQRQRFEAPERIRAAGLDVGNALLWGLTPEWERELELFVEWSRTVGGFDFVATPVLQDVTLSESARVPENFDVTPPFRVGPELYLEIISRLRLAFPESHLVGNTRLHPEFIYGQAAKIVNMCNGYVWTGSRSHTKTGLMPKGHFATDSIQMDFYNPGTSLTEIQELCAPGIVAELDTPSILTRSR